MAHLPRGQRLHDGRNSRAAARCMRKSSCSQSCPVPVVTETALLLPATVKLALPLAGQSPVAWPPLRSCLLPLHRPPTGPGSTRCPWFLLEARPTGPGPTGGSTLRRPCPVVRDALVRLKATDWLPTSCRSGRRHVPARHTVRSLLLGADSRGHDGDHRAASSPPGRPPGSVHSVQCHCYAMRNCC